MRDTKIIRILCAVTVLCTLLTACAVGTNGTDVPTDTSNIGDTLADTTLDSMTDTEIKPPLDEWEKQKLYDAATQAANNGSYQYAYGLFMRLGHEGYKDSAEKAQALRRTAYATPVEFVCKDVFYQLADTDVLGDGGFLYIDSEGTVQYLYATKGADGVAVVHTLTPDPTLKNIRSVLYSECFYMGEIWICLLLDDDGKVHLMYDEQGLEQRLSQKAEGEKNEQSHAWLLSAAKELKEELSVFISEQRDVVSISYVAEGPAFLFLHSDGSVSAYTTQKDKDSIASWSNIVDIYYHAPYDIIGIDKDGKYIRTNDKETAGEDIFLLPGLSGASDAVFKEYSEEYDSITFLLDGNVKIGNKKNVCADDYSYIYAKENLGYTTQGGTYMIDIDGKVVEVVHHSYEDQAWFDALVAELKKVNVKS